MARHSTKIAIAVVATFFGSQVSAQSDGSADAELAAKKKQLRLMEEKLDRLQKQTAASTAAGGEGQCQSGGQRQDRRCRRRWRRSCQGSASAAGGHRQNAEQPTDDLYRG
jgi:hypothetical protein